jgi:predicted metal-binding membrane protein
MNARPETQSPSLLPLRDRLVIWGCLGALTLLAWIYLVRMPTMSGGGMEAMGMAMPMPHQWTLGDMWLVFVMWVVMMVAMMLPGASPMLMMYARTARGKGLAARLNVWLFAGGYIIVWALYSALATIAQTALQKASVLSDALRVSPLLGGLILIVAGLYQFTPLKTMCLSHCRSPIGFFMTQWRDGAIGAVAMGIRHGSYCVGCCWSLMLLLFVAGVMNLLWVAVISVLILIEKVSPYGKPIANAAGAALIGSGLLVAALG